MTSQKRFRHQENSNTGSRTRDLPPRFKRQKSCSGQTPPDSRAASPPSSQAEKSSQADNMTKRSQIQTSPGTTMNKGSPSQNAPSGSVPYSVLRPVNYKNSDIPRTSVPQQVFRPVPSNQMLTHGYVGPHPVMLSPNSVMLPQTVIQSGHHLAGSTSYYNENCAPSPSFYMPQCGPMSPWSTPGYGSPYHSSCSSPAPTVASPAPEPEQVDSPPPSARFKSAGSPSAQYTDPDLRTIEMLRELERVADKESQEAEDGGSDRKTLVSHHLRMLMCAMDRYTENIDDEMDDSTRDVISSSSSNVSSPSRSPVSVTVPKGVEVKARNNLPKGRNEGMQADFYQNRAPEPVMSRSPRPVLGSASAPPPMPRPQPSSSNQSFLGTYNHVPQMSSFQDIQPYQQQEWNLWSGPSFDFGGVLGHPHFETFQDTCFPTNKERKPLYKR